MSRDLKRRGFAFVGPTVCYSIMQATGLVNDHLVDCFRWREVQEGPAWSGTFSAGAASRCGASRAPAAASASPRRCGRRPCRPSAPPSSGCCARRSAATARVLVHVDLDHLEPAGVLLGQLLEDRADEPARPAPRRPEVHHHRRGCLGLDVEGRVGGVHQPRQRLAAVAAVRRALGARPDLVLLAATRAHQGRDGGRPDWQRPVSMVRER